MKVKFWYIVFIVFTATAFLGLMAPGIISKAASVSEEMNFEQLNISDSLIRPDSLKESIQRGCETQNDTADIEESNMADYQSKYGFFEHVY